MANVWIKIGRKYKFMHEVLVVPIPEPHIKVVTRAKARKQKEQQELDKTLDARDGTQPISKCVK